MGDKNDGLVIFLKILKIFFAFLLEGSVTNGKNFVEQKDVTASADSDREGEADLHTTRIVL